MTIMHLNNIKIQIIIPKLPWKNYPNSSPLLTLLQKISNSLLNLIIPESQMLTKTEENKITPKNKLNCSEALENT
jgi:hypothetical protein